MTNIIYLCEWKVEITVQTSYNLELRIVSSNFPKMFADSIGGNALFEVNLLKISVFVYINFVKLTSIMPLHTFFGMETSQVRIVSLGLDL